MLSVRIPPPTVLGRPRSRRRRCRSISRWNVVDCARDVAHVLRPCRILAIGISLAGWRRKFVAGAVKQAEVSSFVALCPPECESSTDQEPKEAAGS